MAPDPRFTRNRDRVVNRAACDAVIEKTLIRRPAAEWVEKLMAAGVPCSRINTVLEALADPQTAAMDMVVDIQHPTAGLFRSLGHPLFFSCTPGGVRYPPPVLGEHTDAVLKEVLGLGEKGDSGAARRAGYLICPKTDAASVGKHRVYSGRFRRCKTK